eukprot:TRINITY_DN6519_c0_g2_i1.p1 TRINITY_DN6519_c0_g2~~TRINITY_DN6519_c0_g2_i1.p1  ORF type:complete len:403 (+),score=90.39 TRINITY_DN6519_c0_g2_i1:507-1715(+)
MDCSRQLKRLEASSRAPVLSLLLEALRGAHTIAAHELESHFVEEFDRTAALNATNALHLYMLLPWLTFVLDCMGTSVLLACVLSTLAGIGSPMMTGLALAYALSFLGKLQWVTRQSIEAENYMIAVERLQVWMELTPEQPVEGATTTVPTSWPASGAIEIRDLCVRYRPGLPLVLDRLSVSVAAGERVGLIGRTGCGKSTLASALFRVLQPSGGSIVVDGVDISSVLLSVLRSRLSIIPQEAVLWSGTLRHNLDPLECYQDDQLWGVLQQCGMGEVVRMWSAGLDTVLGEQGSMSTGQRQLVGISRALLKQCSVVVLDEASASMDSKTDSLVQRTISQGFSGSTMLIIAHRTETLHHCDRVLQLEAGSPTRVTDKTEHILGASRHLEEGAQCRSVVSDSKRA